MYTEKMVRISWAFSQRGIILQISTVTHSEANMNQSEPI